MGADGSRVARRLRGHPQEFRVSFARGGLWPRETGCQTHYVQVGPRYRERVWGVLDPPFPECPFWQLRSNDGTYRRSFRTLKEAKDHARALLAPTPEPGT